MTMMDTLFGMIPASSRGQQWVAEELQLINWGGYDGGRTGCGSRRMRPCCAVGRGLENPRSWTATSP